MVDSNNKNREKKIAAERASDFVESRMIVGLGTGSTVYFTVVKLGELARSGLKFKAVSTSDATTQLALTCGIQIISIDEVNEIDLTIDGADEADNNFNGIKGGGGALLFEKIVAMNSKKNIWIIDSEKLVDKLGKFPLPVEIVPFGYKRILSILTEMSLKPHLRKKNDEIFLTDSGNYIIDLNTGEIDNAKELNDRLKLVTGIIETGLFIDIADKIIIGKNNSTEILQKK